MNVWLATRHLSPRTCSAERAGAARLQEVLMPLVDRFNQMFLRNLKALRELKVSPINVNIGQAEQVNVAQQQVNVAGPDA